MKFILNVWFIVLALFWNSNQKLFAQTSGNGLIGDWTFHPNYTLSRNAANYPGKRIDPPRSRFQQFKTYGAPIIFYEQNPTQRIVDFLNEEALPKDSFSVEFWLLNHVNLPVGTAIAAKGKSADAEPSWLLGYWDDEIVFHLNSQSGSALISTKIEESWKKYWTHVVGTYDGQKLLLYLNGVERIISEQVGGNINLEEGAQIEVAGYFEHEPYMEISNLLKAARLYDRALSIDEIKIRFNDLKSLVEEGRLFADTFHFNSGPYLHLATANSINLVWETDRMAKGSVAYGTTIPLDKKINLEEFKYIQEVTLDDLTPHTPYYYEISAIEQSGEEMKSGILTFSTAVDEQSAFSFCIIGDTESRPHINHKLGELIWDERPDFIMHLGDVTDGGKEPHKFEWNYEYFTGITPVTSRIPIFPVPGNGESDLYWYKKYHRLPGNESYYSFTYGNAEFFMLNSNETNELRNGGVQYEWLKSQLESSNAEWKFVSHHHCPVSSDENDFGDTWKGVTSPRGDAKFDDLKRLYESVGVDVVFYGHVHAYERSWPIKDGQVDREEGVIYIKSGGAGGHLEDFTPTGSWFSNNVQRGNHYCKVDIYDNIFSFKMFDIEGRLKDFFELEKEIK